MFSGALRSSKAPAGWRYGLPGAGGLSVRVDAGERGAHADPQPRRRSTPSEACQPSRFREWSPSIPCASKTGFAEIRTHDRSRGRTGVSPVEPEGVQLTASSNGCIEGVNALLRDELLNREIVPTSGKLSCSSNPGDAIATQSGHTAAWQRSRQCTDIRTGPIGGGLVRRACRGNRCKTGLGYRSIVQNWAAG